MDLFLPTPSTRRATLQVRRGGSGLPISTHALTWRATAPARFQLCSSSNFYPRPHMEGDRLDTRSYFSRKISTHALTWRATSPRRLSRAVCCNFYPRPHMEGDAPARFQLCSSSNFYPRPRVEGDVLLCENDTQKLKFLSTPSRRGRHAPRLLLGGYRAFLSTPSRRGRLL